jgi:hypothetical protein
VAPVEPKPDSPPVQTPTRPVTASDHRNKRPRHASSTAAKDPESVQAKFRKVRGEYSAFKSQYGGVLEDRWNAIASEITFGKPDDKNSKYERVDRLLDELRAEMGKVRAGR